MIPTRADRCTYVLYADKPADKHKTEESLSRESKTQGKPRKRQMETTVDDDILEYLLDPVSGSPAKGRKVEGVVALHVDVFYS